MFGTRSEIELERTRHKGLWKEEAACGVLLLPGGLLDPPAAACIAIRFSVAIEAGAAEGLDAESIRTRLRNELRGDIEKGLPGALGVELRTVGPRASRSGRGAAGGKPPLPVAANVVRRLSKSLDALFQSAPPAFDWRDDALRRLGYHSLTPHGLTRLGSTPCRPGPQRWRRTLR